MNNIIVLIIFSFFFGITMKIADLLDEHGLNIFYGANLVFGIFWGIIGLGLMYLNSSVANVLLAMIVAFIIRGRIDYLNHLISVGILSFGYFFLKIKFDNTIFIFFVISFLVLGFLKDFRYMNSLNKIKKIALKINNFPYIYGLPSFLFSIITHEWSIFYVFFTYEVSYILTTNIFLKKGYR